jgi:N-acetylglutamate synthase-like GNAT family acetyltransferase
MATIREAQACDAQAITTLLRNHDLRTEGVLEIGTKYWIAEEGPQIVAAIGLELGDTSVLLRSAIVAPDRHGRGIGGELTAQALSWARACGYRSAYCFSTEAGEYWIARGFCPCSVEVVVHALPNAPQVVLFDRLGWLPTEAAFQLALG